MRVATLILSLVTAVAFGYLQSGPMFEEVSLPAIGVDWVHENGASAEKHLPETVGAGCAFLDYDGDGWMDIYLVNSGPSEFFKPTRAVSNSLYRNDGKGRFIDVTDKAGVGGGQYGMGVAAGDYNGDGWTDLYITGFGRTLLYRNNGDGTFSEQAEAAGLLIQGWTTHAVWFDYNKDGRLDLFVASFVRYDPDENRFCGSKEAGRRHYCIPRVFQPTPSFLFRNEGNGRFKDVSVETGIGAVAGKAFGVVATDVNNDGWLDLFVANDTMPNFLFINEGGVRFVETALVAGVAYSEAGEPRSGMGVDAVDFDGDGWQDLFVANIDQEMFSLYRNLKGEEFVDDSVEIRTATLHLSGWGLRFFDFDNDGDEDLILANGHPDDLIQQFKPQVTYRQPTLLMANEDGRFRDISQSAGEAFRKKLSARGLATGDFDNDGAVDVLITTNGGEPILLRNLAGRRNGWIGLELQAVKSSPDASGARITWKAGGLQRQRLRRAGGSYLSYHDPREVLGLGSARAADSVEILWPSGVADRVTGLASGQYYLIREGEGLVSMTRGSVASSVGSGR